MRISRSLRRSGGVVVAVLLVSGSAIALWAVDRARTLEPPIEATRVSLLHLDDLAAAAEARVVLASLRSSLQGSASPDRNGARARRMAEQLEMTFASERGGRAEAWDEIREAVRSLRSQVQRSDPQALAAIADLEDALRALVP
jgi:hypothetical protein